MATKRRKNSAKKRKKYIPAYIAVYGTIFLAAVLLIVLISKLAGGNKQNNNDNDPSNISEITSGTDNVEPSAEATVFAPVSSNKEEDWALYVIGNNNPLPSDFSVEIKTVSGERTLDKRCADYAILMLNDANDQGVGLYVASAYRSVQYQETNLQNYINKLMAQGYTKEDATKQAHREIAQPGCSEHNAGLALDIISNDYWVSHSELDESFELLPQFKWLIENSWKYGFILSYPKGKEEITGFIYEPWHYRFVGLEHAKKIQEIYETTGEHISLNEYIDQYVNNR